ncbi:hypothetical protein EGT07_03100 [Herbaspirillum sp. HC18]|nr:hypothetical protein EGT07_03100 [Herbaspirillum sp. HC18]
MTTNEAFHDTMRAWMRSANLEPAGTPDPNLNFYEIPFPDDLKLGFAAFLDGVLEGRAIAPAPINLKAAEVLMDLFKLNAEHADFPLIDVGITPDGKQVIVRGQLSLTGIDNAMLDKLAERLRKASLSVKRILENKFVPRDTQGSSWRTHFQNAAVKP